jgi:hypothetical protein
MRSLDTNIKADFIQKDRTENTPLSAGTGDSRRGRGKESLDGQSQDRKGSRSRSRSRGFTLSKGPSSPGKKLRRDSEASNRRPKSVDLSQPVGVYTTLSAAGSTASLSEAAAVDTAADPSDFVHYLREIQKPEMVEVGKVHKLRLLLRNETVNWVNGFIVEGGMDEIVQLLYRIMNMTWRCVFLRLSHPKLPLTLPQRGPRGHTSARGIALSEGSLHDICRAGPPLFY